MTHYEELVIKVQQIDDLNKALGLMSWDRETNMPKGGSAERITQMTTLSKLTHEMSTSDEMGNSSNWPRPRSTALIMTVCPPACFACCAVPTTMPAN
ncbi:MAG: hypothetical protein R3C44_06780 [Chloroflexota bacterium]